MAEPNKDLTLFAEDVRAEVRHNAGANPSPEALEDSFSEWVLQQLAEHNEADDGQVLNYRAESRGRWPAAKLNAWAISGDGATLDLFVTQFHGAGCPSIGLPEMRKYFRLLAGFLKRAREGIHTQLEDRDDVFEVARRIHEANESLTTVRLFFLTDGLAPRTDDLDGEKVPGLDVQLVLWDLKKLSQLRVGQRSAIELDFSNDFGAPIPCLVGLAANADYQIYLAFMPGPILAKIYGQHGHRLLERNVRAFLQAKGKINKGLQATIRDMPERFLAYNNGLCCTAAEVKIETLPDGGQALAWVRDFQIVNGGQTTASLYHAVKKERLDVSKIYVQLKLTVLKQGADVPEIVSSIAKYANSQNKVNAADLAANGKFHRDFEELSRTNSAPALTGLQSRTYWYYERARGSYLDDKARQGTEARRREWERMNPSHQKFGKTDLAKYEHAWCGLPHLVCLGAEKNFVRFAEKMEDDGEPSVDRDYFHHMVAKAILWRTAEKLFDSLDLEGYRANSVAYSVSWLAEKSGRRIDLNRVWSEQRLPAGLCDALKAVTQAAWDHLNEQQGNVGEASKKVECWESFRKKEIALPSGWQQDLADTAFTTARNEEEALATAWGKLRPRFLGDSRTIEGLEIYTGKLWLKNYRREAVSAFAALTWDELRARPGLGLKKIRTLVEMMAIAAQN